jgi:hypothetical protein
MRVQTNTDRSIEGSEALSALVEAVVGGAFGAEGKAGLSAEVLASRTLTDGDRAGVSQPLFD